MPSIDEQLQKKKPFKKKTYRSYLSLDETLEDIGQPTAIDSPSILETAVNKSSDVNNKPKIENSPQVQIEPEVNFTPKVQITSKVEDKSHGQISNNNTDTKTYSNANISIPKIQNSPQVQIEPKVILEPEVFEIKNENSVNILDSQVKNYDQNEPRVNNTPQVYFSPEVKNAPKVQIEPQADLTINIDITADLTATENSASEIENTPKVAFAPNVLNTPKVNFKQQGIPIESCGSSIETTPAYKREAPKTRPSNQSETTESTNHFIHQHAAIENFNIHHPNMSKGFTRVPNSILQTLMSGDLSKNELQILSVVLRMTIGFNRESAPISLGVIQNLTGIQSSRISAALNTLSEKNLIKRKSGSINSPNLLSIVYSDEQSKIAIAPRAENAPKVEFESKVENTPKTLGAFRTLDLTCETHLQYINNIQIENLSQSSNFLKELVAPMMKKERERVLKLIEELKNESLDDIQLVFENVFSNKIDTFGAPIKSEIGYLETCFVKHKDWLKSQFREKREQLELKYRSELLKQAEAEQNKAANDEWNKIVLKFQEAFPTDVEQAEAINKYSAKMTGPYSNIFPARRSFAIKAWSENQSF